MVLFFSRYARFQKRVTFFGMKWVEKRVRGINRLISGMILTGAWG